MAGPADVLVSGEERSAWEPLQGLLARRPPGWLVPVTALLAAATALAGVLAVPGVRAADVVAVEVDASAVVTVRARSRDAVLLLGVRSTGGAAVTVAGVDVPGDDVPRIAVDPVRVPAGERRLVEVRLPLPTCQPDGGVVLQLRLDDGTAAQRDVDVPAEVLSASCRAVRPDVPVVAVRVRGVGGERRPDGAGLRGTVLLELQNEGARLEEVVVSADVPGARFSAATLRPLDGAGRATVRLAYAVPSCADLRRTGRVSVAVRDDVVGAHVLGFRVTEDEEARTVRDVDLGILLAGCDDGGPAP